MKKSNYGRDWELKICSHIENMGMEILEKNFSVKGGEIDIIAKEKEFICFIEVKFRTQRAIDAYRSVGYKKQRRIIKAAEKYLYQTNCKLQPRFDAVFVFSEDENVYVEYIKNAYDGSGSL